MGERRVFVLFLLSLFAISIAPHSSNAKVVDKIAAVVNNDVILLSDILRFEKTLSLRQELDPLFGLSGDMSASPNRKQVLDFLILERLVLQSFKISDSDVEQEIQTVQRNNNLSREQLVEFLKSKGFGFDDYFELMRIGLAKRNLLDREIRTRVNISEDDVRNYYYNMAVKDSTVPLEYALQLIVIHESSYKSPSAAQQAAQSALKAIRQGEAFGEVAKRFSDDPSAAEPSNDLGYVPSDQLAEPLKSAVRKLEIRGVSGVLKGSGIYIIAKLLDARSTESKQYTEAKGQIRELLAKDEYKKQLVLWAERARNNAYVHTN